MISLQKNATTTPGIRQRLSGGSEPASVIALRYGVSEETARKWKRRDSVQDLSATPHTLQTTLTPAQEAVVVELRRILLLPLDDLLAVCREFLNPDVSRSGLDPSPSGLNRWRSLARLAAAWRQQSQGVAAQDPRRTAQDIQNL